MVTEEMDLRTEYFDKYLEPEHHMEALMSASIITLDLRARILYPLANSGIRTVQDLIRQYHRGLKSIHQIGREAAADIYKVLTDAALID